MTQVYLYGIDLSNYQGKANMDLDKVLTKNPKCKVVIVKVSEGISFTDAYAKKFIEIALKHGCVVGVYHFGRPDKNGYLEEAKFFLSLSLKYRGKVFYVLDWEVKNGASNAKWAKGFLDYVAKQTGSIPVFYSYESMINANNYSSFTKYPLWVAKYRDYVSDRNFDMSHAGTAPNVKWWSEYIAWQFTSVGRLDGYDGNLDCNAFYVDENYLKALISCNGTAPITVPAKDPVDVLLQIAQSEVGCHEGPNNSNKYGDEMHSIQPSNMDRNAPWCFVANTMILTDGGYKPIEGLCVGDAVLNASGSGFNRVTNIMSREHEVCSVKAYGSIDMKSTPDHPFLSKQRIGVRKDWKYSPLEYRPVSDLKKGDDVVTPVTTVLFSEDLSYDEAWVIGYFVGDGWKTSRNDYKLCGNSKKEELIYSHISSLRKDKDYKSRTCYEYTILVDKNQRIIPFLDEAGRGAENKVVPKSILFSRKETKSAFLDGYLSADGDKEGHFSTVSKKLALGISKLAFDLGYGCALRYQVRAENQKIYDDRIGKYRDIKIKPIIYIGKINKAEKKCNRLDRIDGTNVYVPIKSFENTGEIRTVYNISVDGDNTYLANNIAVHNCDAFCDWCVLQMCKKFGYGADMARKVLCGDFDDYAYFSVNLYKKAGRWTTKPGRGYQIFFGGDGHTGWVKSVDSKIHTIEGNKGDQVRECSYSLNDSKIIGYGMPRYDLIKGTVTVEEPTVNKNDGILRRGSTGKAVRFIQLCLGGLDDDGSFGWKTLSAVVEFQKSHGLEADGEVGPLTFAAILKTMPLIRKGDKGRYVKALQVALGGLEVDGSFGPLTDAVVREFQKEHSLVVDGEVGKKTWTAIFKYCFC